jgi:hypothetical protein
MRLINLIHKYIKKCLINWLINICILLKINIIYKIHLKNIHNQQQLELFYQKIQQHIKDNKILNLNKKKYKIIHIIKIN